MPIQHSTTALSYFSVELLLRGFFKCYCTVLSLLVQGKSRLFLVPGYGVLPTHAQPACAVSRVLRPISDTLSMD
jgi:hypothetical protein